MKTFSLPFIDLLHTCCQTNISYPIHPNYLIQSINFKFDVVQTKPFIPDNDFICLLPFVTICRSRIRTRRNRPDCIPFHQNSSYIYAAKQCGTKKTCNEEMTHGNVASNNIDSDRSTQSNIIFVSCQRKVLRLKRITISTIFYILYFWPWSVLECFYR